jgi:hypothetical protein
VFGNLTKRFAEKLDDFVVPPSENAILKENYLLEYFPLEALIAMAEEPMFWYDVEKYMWFPILLEKFYKLSRGNLYLLMDWEYREQLTDRRIWCEKNFGTTLSDNLILTADKNRPLLVGGRQDLLIDCDLYNIEKWIEAGGSGLFWPEINWNSPQEKIVKLLHARFKMLKDVVDFLNKPIYTPPKG